MIPNSTSLLLSQAKANLQRTLPSANLIISELPTTESLRLALINADFPTDPLPQEVMQAVIAKPAYWAFCWGSGLALAQWIQANKARLRDREVADIGAGSGVVAIAAKLAGAASAWACDNDPDALLASQANAQLNQVELHYADAIATLPQTLDLVLLADVLYDRSNFPLLQEIKAMGAEIIVADSRVTRLEDKDFTEFHLTEALTLPNLGEFDEFKNVRFFRFLP